MNRQLAQALLGLFIIVLAPARAYCAGERGGDSLTVSLLTCSPGTTEIYSLFGHTGLRVQTSGGGDVVFHYGVFDYDAPHFIWRFVLGETDYAIGCEPFDAFLDSYRAQGLGVKEQVLNLTQEECRRLYQALLVNYLPENRTYRYNYFFDNCATRPRVKVEEAVDGIVKYDDREDIETFRGAVHGCLQGHPWARFGIDLVLGADVDRQMEGVERYFLPKYLHDGFRNALVVPRDTAFRDLVLSESDLCQPRNGAAEMAAAGDGFWTPRTCSLLVLLLVVAVSIYGVVKGRAFLGLDIVLFSLAGCVGLLLTFLTFFSQHPAVDSNWNMVVFHPFHLLFLPLYIRNARMWKMDYYHLANALVLVVFFFCFSVLPQQINTAVVPLALSLWVRSLSYSILAFEHRWR